jgi:hypothetical protein
MTKSDVVATYAYKIVDTEKNKVVNTIMRDKDLKERMLYDVRNDPENANILYLWAGDQSNAVICSMNIELGSISTVSRVTNLKGSPIYFALHESWDKYSIVLENKHDSSKNLKHFTWELKESADINPYENRKYIKEFDLNTLWKSGNSNVILYSNKFGILEASWYGEINFKMEASKDENVQTSDIRDFGIANNQAIVCISNFNEESMVVHYFPLNDESCQKSYKIKEISLIKFFYPVIIIVKGWNEILIYSIAERLYYYVKVNSPVIFESSSLSISYGPELKAFLDLGDYLLFASFSFTVGSKPCFSCTLHKTFLPKFEFPDGKLLDGFERLTIKFLNKNEDAYILQFSNSLMCYAILTYGLTQVFEWEYKKGEIIQIAYQSFYFWNKGGKSVSIKAVPVNLNDT